MSKKILIFGGKGGLGTKLTPLLQNAMYVCVPLNSKDCDIQYVDQIQKMILNTQPDIIISMVARNRDGFIHKLTEESIAEQVNIGVAGIVNIASAALNYFRNSKKRGRLIFLSSVLAEHPVIGTGIYSASKAFIDNFVKTCAKENAKYHITVNSIQLGYFDGGLSETIPTDILNSIVDTIPLKRLGNIEELYKTLEFIINTEYMTGSNVYITGGL